jgi:phospholipid transport system transporter-binding protein
MNERAPAVGEGGFAATASGWTIAGTLTFADAAAVFAASRGLALPGTGLVDLAGLEHADSSALAVMLALKRRAVREGVRVVFTAIPPGMLALAHVYGVEELLAS